MNETFSFHKAAFSSVLVLAAASINDIFFFFGQFISYFPGGCYSQSISPFLEGMLTSFPALFKKSASDTHKSLLELSCLLGFALCYK